MALSTLETVEAFRALGCADHIKTLISANVIINEMQDMLNTMASAYTDHGYMTAIVFAGSDAADDQVAQAERYAHDAGQTYRSMLDLLDTLAVIVNG